MKKLHTRQEVEPLLARFMDGTSTLEEEAQLAEFFRTHQVAGEWKEYQEMFRLFDQGEVEVPMKKENHRHHWRWGGIAAAIALIVASLLLFHQPNGDKPQPLTVKTDTISTQRQKTEESEKTEPQEEKKDTVDIHKEIERSLYKTPKVYLAKTPAPLPAPTEEPTEVESTDVELLAIEADIERIKAENKARMNAMRTAEDPYEMRNEIRRRGERLTQSIEMAISNDNY